MEKNQPLPFPVIDVTFAESEASYKLPPDAKSSGIFDFSLLYLFTEISKRVTE